jgi:2-C-methyl-D-erythritol 4-phosphate cytidylyltransferase
LAGALSLPWAAVQHAHTLAVLVAAGRSSRMGAALRKPFLTLEGTPVLVYAVRALCEAPSVERLVVVVHPDDLQRAEEILRGSRRPRQLEAILPGGEERIDSVRTGALWPCEGIDTILVHDGARPLVTPAAVEGVIRAAREHGAALLALALKETVKRSRDGRFVEETLPRELLWKAQTPQVFEAERFRVVLERAARDGFRPTDDSALWERYVGPVALVPGAPSNLKLTQPEDLEIAQAIVRARHHPA